MDRDDINFVLKWRFEIFELNKEYMVKLKENYLYIYINLCLFVYKVFGLIIFYSMVICKGLNNL